MFSSVTATPSLHPGAEHAFVSDIVGAPLNGQPAAAGPAEAPPPAPQPNFHTPPPAAQPTSAVSPKKRQRQAAGEAGAPLCKRNLTEMFEAAAAADTRMTSEAIERLLRSIPFAGFRAILSDQKATALEQFLKDKLVSVLRTTTREDGGAIYTATDPVLGECRLRLDGAFDSPRFEVYVRYRAAKGGTKNLYQQIFLAGPRQGVVRAYAKPIKDERLVRDPFAPPGKKTSVVYVDQVKGRGYRGRLEEMVSEIRISRLFTSALHVLPVVPVMRRSRPSECKGIHMPWCNGGNLLEYNEQPVRPDSFGQRLAILRDVALGMKQIHDQQLCHMDMKSANVLLRFSSEGVKAYICDLGRVRKKDERLEMPISTRGYIAPEQIVKNVACAPSMDMWNIGLIALELAYGVSKNLYLFSENRRFKDEDFFQSAKYPAIQARWRVIRAAILDLLSGSLLDPLIRRLLSLDPSQRPSAAEVVAEVDRLLAEMQTAPKEGSSTSVLV